MRKLYTFLLLALACLTSAWAQQDTILVSSAQELKEAIQNDQYAKIRLTADIDISDMGRIRDTFSGVIIGGYWITDSITGEPKVAPNFLFGKRGQGKGADHYLFETVQNARFENIAIANMRVQDEDNNNLGVLARKAVGCTFRSFSIVGCSIFCNKDNAGAIAGVAESCTFELVRNVDSEISADGICSGGLVGTSKNCHFISCATSLHTHVFADGRITDAAYVGGITGFSASDIFFDCVNYGWVCGNEDKVGGIVGSTLGSNFLCCYNRGSVLQCPEQMFIDIMNDAVKHASVLEKGNWITEKVAWSTLGVGTVVAIAVIIALGVTPIGFAVFSAVIVGTVVATWLSHALGTILNWTINAHDELGAIAGNAENCTFEQCVNDGNYAAVDDYCGGIVGYGVSTTINNCYNGHYPGVKNLDSKPAEDTTGSIIGYAKRCTVTNNASSNHHNMIGQEVDPNHASGNNYRLTFGSYSYQIGSEMAMTFDLLKTGIAVYWLNNSPENKAKQIMPWRQTLTGETPDWTPVLDVDHNEVKYADLFTTIITTPEQLVAFAESVNKGNQFACAALDADIDLTGIDWQPIGRDGYHFCGIFDGRNHTISGLKVNADSSDKYGAGLFGTVDSHAEIRNVILASDCEIISDNEMGAAGIAGRYYTWYSWGSVTIENCGSYANVSAPKHAGAILGRVQTDGGDRNVKLYIDNCFNMGNITASNGNSAHLVGYAKNSGHLTNSWTNGRIKATNAYTDPYDFNNPSGEAEYFAGYGSKIYIENCYASAYASTPRAEQNGVTKLLTEDFTSGRATYLLNGKATEGELSWYQKLGDDEHPMFISRGGDIVYPSVKDVKEAYTNDLDQCAYKYYGPLRVSLDYSTALLDAASTKNLTLKKKIEVETASIERSFTANVPSTLVLPFSADIDSTAAKYFTFETMDYDEETGKYTAIMKQAEGGLVAYTPYLAMFAEDTEGLTFKDVTLQPAAPAVTQQGEWYFIGSTNYKTIGLKEEESEYYYGYAGMTFDGFKLGEFSRLGEGASINPFRCYMRHIASESAPDSFDVITKKAPTRSAVPDNQLSVVTEEIPMPKAFDVILKGANGETGIATFDDETGEFTFQGWYDLNGNRVDANYSGVRISEGKKVIVK